MWGQDVKPLPFNMVVRDKVEMWRAADFWPKEPETILWLQSFEHNSVFWDIGANIGVFSLYAAYTGCNVFAFEPDMQNISRLNDNTWQNKDLAFVLPQNTFKYAISDFDGKSTFYVPKSGPGRSGGQIGAARHENGQEFIPAESYEVETYKIDTLAERFGIPNHIKIDVDGIEWRILQGGSATLAHQDVKSVLVEVNKNHGEIETFMTDRGFTSFNRFNGPDLNRRINQKQYNKIYIRET